MIKTHSPDRPSLSFRLLSLSSALLLGAVVAPTSALAVSNDDTTPDTSVKSEMNETGRHKTRLDSTQDQDATPANTSAKTAPEADEPAVTTLRDMFEQGEVDGNLRTLYYANHNAFFLDSVQGDHDRNTASVGGKLGFTTAALQGFSLRLSAYAQRNFTRSSSSNDLSETGFNRDLGRDISTLGEAYLQWQGHDFRIRAGNQAITSVPFTSTYDYRIIPQLYQGVSTRYGNDESYIAAMRMYRYKSRIADSFDRTTNYNAEAFESPPPNTTEETDGFWALGGAHAVHTDDTDLSGQAWFLNYKDYANMYYLDGKVAAASGSVKPFFALQYIRETDDGRALVGDVDHHTYGAQLGLTHNSLTATLNYNHIPHENGTFLNGALVTPYAHNEASGPLFAQPYLTSTQDLGSGDAYAAEVKGSPFANTFMGARYSFMDLTPAAGGESIDQAEYLVYAIYSFKGALKGLSVKNFFAYQTQEIQERDYWENRFAIEYAF